MNINSTRVLSRISMAVAATLVAASAGAASFTWDLQNQSQGLSSFSEAAASGGSLTLGFKAYYVPTVGVDQNTFIGSNVTFSNQGTSGLGMTSPNEPTGAPQHAIDSISPNREYVVIDACNFAVSCATTVDWSSISIGWGVDNWNNVGGTQVNNQADIRLWAVNSNPTSVSGLGTGFTFSNLTTTANTTNNLNGANGGVNVGASRYLVIAGDVNDAFKLKAIGGTTGTPPGQVPEPASLGLLGLGLLGLGLARRRKAKAA